VRELLNNAIELVTRANPGKPIRQATLMLEQDVEGAKRGWFPFTNADTGSAAELVKSCHRFGLRSEENTVYHSLKF